MATPEILIFVCVFVAVSSLFVIGAMMWNASNRMVEARVQSVASQDITRRPVRRSPSAIARIGTALESEDETKSAGLRSSLLQAGLYQRHSTTMYLLSRAVLLFVPIVVGWGLASVGMLTWRQGIGYGTAVGIFGSLAPMLWLKQLKRKRQKNIRRAIPDALDIMVICLEAGISLPGSIQRVTEELKDAHPLLAHELAIVLKEIQLGRTTGDALRGFADRLDTEELRSLAAVVVQAERYGASVVNALRVHANDLRLKRHQYAEGQAQKAVVKLIFPTVFFIFPALYIVLMGPAGLQLMDMLRELGH